MSVINSRTGGKLKPKSPLLPGHMRCQRCGNVKRVKASRLDPAVGYYCRDCKTAINRGDA